MNHKFFMSRALNLAYTNLGNVSPNPSVGALLVKDNHIIGQGVTQPPGGNHAEIEAIRNCKDPGGATLYTTLEPCSHTSKRTSPCTNTIIESKIARVVIAARDPNPQVNGAGTVRLRAAGIKVTHGVVTQEAQKMHEFFFHWITHKTPFVTIKVAQTLNGSMTWGDEKHKQISSQESLKRAHELRSKYDAIIVGINTILTDDPQLTTRLVAGKNPVRVVLDSNLTIKKTARVLNKQGETIIFCSDIAKKEKIDELAKLAIIIPLESDKYGISLSTVLKELGNRNITSLLVEGGPTVIASFLNQGLAQKMIAFVAPKTNKGKGFYNLLNTKSLRLRSICAYQTGKDIAIEGYL